MKGQRTGISEGRSSPARSERLVRHHIVIIHQDKGDKGENSRMSMLRGIWRVVTLTAIVIGLFGPTSCLFAETYGVIFERNVKVTLRDGVVLARIGIDDQGDARHSFTPPPLAAGRS